MSDTIDVVINIEDISSQLNSARSQLVSFKKELSDMPDMSETFTEGLDRTISAIELLQKKATEYDSSSSSPRRQTLASDQLSGLRDVNVSTQLFSQNGSFSVSLAKQMFGGLSAAAQVELNKSTAEIAAMIRSSLGSLRSKSVTGMARDLLLSPDAQRIYQSRMSHVTERQYEQYIEAQLPHVAPMHQLGEYQVARHGRHSRATVTPSLQTVIPDSYLASYKAKAYQGPQLSRNQQDQYMQQDQRELLRNEIMQNDAAARAARAVPGLMQRSRDNHPMLAKNITRQQFEAYRRNLWNDYVARASGRESSRIDIFDPGLPDEERRRAYARMNGASAGQVLKAMRATEGLVVDDAWGAAEVRGKFERLPREARRSQEQYEVAKYTIDGIAAKANPARVMISESPNTRLLGMSGRHNQFSDTVAVVSLSGYDKSDAAHRAQLEHLLSGSPVSLPGSNKKYIAQNMHGTGEDAVLRMVEAEAYRTVMQREHQWLKDNGLISQDGSTGMSGTNYWNNFIRENMDFGSIQGLRRHYDATGKGWTPGHDIEANLQNRNFAMVDFSRISGDKRQRFADGLAWLGKDILPQGSIQGRFAVAGKGTLHQLNHKTLGDWARSVGLISAEERFILPGIHGDVDLTDMHGMFDVSQIKNLPAYEHFSTSDAANDAFTKMIRRYGISSMTTYNDSETRSKGIGTQAMMFMKLPKSMQDAQAQEYQRRINALMTETGIRTFILGGEDNPIRAQLEAGEIDITNPQITSMVEKEKESLQRRMIAGEWIDFSDSGQVTNQKINKTPITSLFEQAGLSRAEQIAQLRTRMQSKGFTEDYSDDDIAGIWGLGGVRNGAIVDFTRPDAELVAINRSPNGFGQFVYGRNYANQARAIYEAFGITPQGVYVSEEDMFRLGDADYDGDGAKTVYGDLAIAMRDTAVLHKQLRKSVKNVGQARERTLDYGDQIQGFSDTAVQRRLAVESSLAAAAAMGLTSGAGEKAAQFDLSNERNRRMLAAAIQAERAYSIATAGFKNASEVELTPEMLATNVLGRKWQFQPTKFSRVFNTTGQDGLDIPNAEDIFMATVDGKQIPVNMAELRKLNIDRTNLPSINQDSVVMGIRAANAMGPQGDSIQQMLAVEQALDQGIGYGNLGEASIRLLRNMRAMKLQTNAGLRGISTQEEAVLIEQQIAEARREINAQADSLAVGNSGKVRLADGTEMSLGAFVAAAARAANIDIAENHLHQFGMTQAAVRERLGDDATQAIEQMQPKYGIALPTKATEPDLIKRRPSSPEMPETTQPKDRDPAPDIEKESTPHARESAMSAPMPSSPPPQAFCPKCGASYNAALGSCPNCSNNSPVQPARSLREFLSRVQVDMTENGLPQDEATKLVTQWYNQNIPSEQDPIVMDDATSAKILEKYLRDGTIDSIYDYALEAPAGDTPGVPRGKDILMSDLETFRQVEGSRAVYEDMMSAMRQTSSKWYGMAANQEENPEYGFYSKAIHQLKNTRLRFDNALQNGDASMFGADTALGTDLRNQLGLMEENYFAATRAHMSRSGDNAFEALRSSVAGTGDEFDKQLAKLESWSKSVEKLEQQLLAFKKAREEMPADSDTDTEADRKAIKAQEARIEEAKRLSAQGRVDLLKDNNESFAAKFESLSESMTGKTASPQEKIRRTVEQYKKQITKYQEQLDESFAKNLLTEEDYYARKTQQAELSTYASEGLERELQARNDAQEALQLARTKRQESSLRRRANQLARDPYGTRRNSLWGRATMERDGRIDQYDNLISSYEETIAQKKNKLKTMDLSSEGYANASAEVEKLEKELSEAQAAASKLEKTGSAMGFVFAEIGQRVGQVISQFGRQMFQQAIQEAKRFVIEFDTAMTEIQMITMKTDNEIASLGDSLIQTAIDMKVSVSDVTSAAADLYRQGLDDNEVSVRMEDVLKFAKVAGMKTEDSSKIITTALSNDLVFSSGEAMDALVAQGDSAATTAAEIAKGMQKSAASAKQAGVSYEQLVTMLTIITSKTQLGGNQAGTALQTLMYRLYKVSEGDDYYDEDGNRVASNDATKALKQLGVSIYDDNGNQRGAYDIMVDIARNWNNADTISQERVLNALGAGRQRSNIATLIQGLAEDDGALAEKYMALATESEGVTDEKYLAYLNSLEAAMTNVKNSFDQLINSFQISGQLTDFLNWIAEFIQGLSVAAESIGSMTGVQNAFIAALAALVIVRTILAPTSLATTLPTLIGGGLAIGALLKASADGNKIKAERPASYSEIRTQSLDIADEKAEYTKMINESIEIIEKGRTAELTQLEIDTVQDTLDQLSDRFGIAAMTFTGATEELTTAAGLLKNANKIMDNEFASVYSSTYADSINTASNQILSQTMSVDEAIATLNQQINPDFEEMFAFKNATDLTESNWFYAQKHLQTPGFRNPYLTGAKEYPGNDYYSSSEIEQQYQNQYRVIDAWLTTLLRQWDSLELIAGSTIPPTLENARILFSYEYENLPLDKYLWHSQYGGEDGESKFGEDKQQFRSTVIDTWNSLDIKDQPVVRTQLDNQLISMISELTSINVSPYTDTVTSEAVQKYIYSQVVDQGYLDNGKNGLERWSIFKNTWDSFMSVAKQTDGTYDFDKWQEIDKIDGFMPIWTVYNSATGELIRKNLTREEADLYIQELKDQGAQQKQAWTNERLAQWDEANPTPKYSNRLDQSSTDLPEKPVEPTKSNYEIPYKEAQYRWAQDVGENGINGIIYPNGIGSSEDAEYAYMSLLNDGKHDPSDIGMFMVRQMGYDNVRTAMRSVLFGLKNDETFGDYSEASFLKADEAHSKYGTIDMYKGIFARSSWTDIPTELQTQLLKLVVPRVIEQYEGYEQVIAEQFQSMGPVTFARSHIDSPDLFPSFFSQQDIEEKNEYIDWIQDNMAPGDSWSVFSQLMLRAGKESGIPLEQLPQEYNLYDKMLSYAKDLANVQKNMMYQNASKPSIQLRQKMMQEQRNEEFQKAWAEYETELLQYETAQETIEREKQRVLRWEQARSFMDAYYNQVYDENTPEPDYTISRVDLPSGDTGSSSANTNYTSDPFSTGLANYLNSDSIAQQLLIDSMLEDVYINSITDMQTFLNHLKDSPIKDLATIVSSVSDGRQSYIIDNAVEKNADGSYKIDDSGHWQVNDNKSSHAWNEVLSFLVQNSSKYSSIAANNLITQAESVNKSIENLMSGTRLTEFESNALPTVLGDSLAGKYQALSAAMWDTAYEQGDIDSEGRFIVQDGNLKTDSSSVRKWYDSLSDEDKAGASWDQYLEAAMANNQWIFARYITEEDKAHTGYRISNYKYGIGGVTSEQMLPGVQQLLAEASSGNISNYLQNLDQSILDDYYGSFPSLSEYVRAEQIIADSNDARFMYETDGEMKRYTLNDIASMSPDSDAYIALNEALDGIGRTAEDAIDSLDELQDSIAITEKRYGKYSQQIIDLHDQLTGSVNEATTGFRDMNSAMLKAANNQYYRQKYQSGDTTNETLEAVMGMTNMGRDAVASRSSGVQQMLEMTAQEDLRAVQNYADAIEYGLNAQPEEVKMSLPQISANPADISGVAEQVRQYDESLYQLMMTFASNIDAYAFAATQTGTNDGAKTVFDFVVEGLGNSGSKPYSGSGGGGGKSASEKLLEEFEREQKLWEHRRKMIQYEATRYQNAGELSNYAIMLRHEANEIQRHIDLREKQLEQLREQMRKTERYSDDWYTLRDAIMSGEEALSELLNDAEDLDRTLEEVQQEILKLHTALESEVHQELEARIQKEQSMLDGAVQIQETILEAIRERYRKEWKLMQEDLNKKRDALEEEIAMIDERLQRRKDAEDEAAKYEELAELQRQLALISMDSTRTKDQAKLREKIAEIENELSWDSAEDEAEKQKEALQNQVDAYDDYETEYQEWLDEYLEDANNFAEEVNKVMAMNQEDLLAWLSENVEAFSLSLDEAQEQMLKGWTDTFKQMRGIVDTYWEEITKVLSSKESFVEYMKQSDAYVYASESEKAQMEYNWNKMYDDWIAAKKVSDEAENWDHNDGFETSGDSDGADEKRYTVAFGGWDSAGNWISGVISEPTKYAMENQYRIRTAGLTDVVRVDGGTKKIGKPASSNLSKPSLGGSLSEFAPIAKAYETGGYVDYTGLAVVHGSPSAPEAFLSANDTALVRSMLDAWQFVQARPLMSNLDGIIGKAQTNTIGDVHITITEASFAEDADYEEVARRVGAAFTKELAMQGFRTASFNF